MRRGRGSMPEVCQSHVKTRTLMPRSALDSSLVCCQARWKIDGIIRRLGVAARMNWAARLTAPHNRPTVCRSATLATAQRSR
jgi:hypothetical protein